MAITEVATAIHWQADHADKAGAPCTGRVVRAERAILDTETEVGRRMRELGRADAGGRDAAADRGRAPLPAS